MQHAIRRLTTSTHLVATPSTTHHVTAQQHLTRRVVARVSIPRNNSHFTRMMVGLTYTGKEHETSMVMPETRMLMMTRRHASSAAAAATEQEFVFNVPSMGDSISEGKLSAWNKKVGDYVAENDTLAVIETDKVSVEVKATGWSGKILEIFAKVDDTVLVGAPLAKIAKGGAPSSPAESSSSKPASTAAGPKTAASPPPPPPASKPAAPPPPSPSKPAASPPSPPPSSSSTPAPPSPPSSSSPPPTSSGITRSTRRVKMSPMRKRIAERLVDAQSTGALLTTFNEIDMSAFMETRAKHKELFEKTHHTKLGFMSVFVRAAAVALKEIPAVNASIEGTDIVYHDYVDMSIAVSAPRGLVVPVLRNVDNMSFAEIEKEVAILGNKAKEDKLTLEEMSGGTFTITNGGVFGSLMSTPMINAPQSAILGMHAIKNRPVVLENGSIVSRPMMYVALTYDHRLIDGRESVTFLKSICGKIEDPLKLLFGL